MTNQAIPMLQQIPFRSNWDPKQMVSTNSLLFKFMSFSHASTYIYSWIDDIIPSKCHEKYLWHISCFSSRCKMDKGMTHAYLSLIKECSAIMGNILVQICSYVLNHFRGPLDKLSKEDLIKIVRHTTDICYFHYKILKEQADLGAYFRISNPFLILKSTMIMILIRKRWKHDSVTQPPQCLSAIIRYQSTENILQCFFSKTGQRANYWLADFEKDSYLGSSKKPFLINAGASSRFKQHITHAILHAKSSIHKCRQVVSMKTWQK